MNRTGRRRRIGATAAGVTLALALVGGIVLSRRVPDQAATQGVAATTAAPVVPAMGWNAAMVGRDDRTITVWATPGDTACKELVQPQATLTEQTDTQVVVAVSGRVVDATDCATSGLRVPLVVSLQKPLGGRVLRDATSALPPPTFSDRDLPDLTSDKRWSPHPSHCDEGFCQGYNGPNGSTLFASASASAGRTVGGGNGPSPVGTMLVGSHRGTITGSPGSFWSVQWEVGDLTYSLRLTPSEGEKFSLAQFRTELASLRWS
ncbi:hypothetical protein C7C45_14615 [Micromonospora arborensis]|uniref:Uncharacterized protein n=1 Tax=Micromonospora arborensis TaxID=2116518 RepID=A0A318P252_9ACTN|nr:hypothetical protein [Micromonospora arborensis]PYC69919.1 hypothetical protein C7C45_14615 [Micromonospora arborensis]